MKFSFITLLFLGALFISGSVYGQDVQMPDLDKSPMDMAYYPARSAFRTFEKDETKKAGLAPVMRVIYSRPQAKGRTVMGELVPMGGEVWRVGANENAELQIIQPATLGDVKLEPGRYSLHIIAGEDEWTLAINSDLDLWGSYAYDESKDVARVTGKVSTIDTMVEAFTCMFTDDALIMAWENTMVTFPVSK